METPRKLIYLILIVTFWTGCTLTYANNENPDQCEKEKSDEEEECPDNESNDNGSISIRRAFGKIPWEEKPGGRFNIMRVKPSPVLVTPEALRYNFWGNLSIFSIDPSVDDFGNPFTRVVLINHLERMYIYDFLPGESVAVPKGSSRSSLRRLVMEDANGDPVTENPVQLTEYYGDGSCRVFDYATRELIRYCDENGRIIDLSNPDYGVEVIRDGNRMRQVKAPEGLADVVVLSEDAYEINYYTYEAIGTKDIDGDYQPIGTPYKTFTLENIDPEPDRYNHIRVTETYGSKSWVTEYNYSDAFEQWEMVEGGGLRRETKYLASSDENMEVFIRELRDQSGNVVSKTRKTVKNFSWDEHALRVVEVVQDPDGIGLTKTIDYYDDPAEVGRYGNRKETVNTDGSWIRYDYDSEGRKIEEVVPWLDSPIGVSNDQAKVTEYSYTPVAMNDVPLSFDIRPRTVTEKTLGIVTAKTFYAYLTNDSGEKVEIKEQAATQNSSYGDPGNLRTARTWYAPTAPAEKSGRLKSVAYPDGRVESYDYALDQNADQFTEIKTLQAIINTVATDVPNKSTRMAKTWDFQGNLIKEAFFVYTGTDYELVSTTTHAYDDQLHLLESVKDGRVLRTQVWENGEPVSVTDENGTERQFSYDALKRMDSETKIGQGAQPDVVTLYTRDLGEIDCGCDGKMTTTILAGDLSLETRQEKDAVGRVSLQVDASGYSTGYSYANSGRTVTKVNPNTSTVISNRYLDGRLKSVTGDGIVHEYYTYGVNVDGTAWTRVDTANSNYHEVAIIAPETKLRFVKTTTDILGRLIREEQPTFRNKSTAEKTYSYNNRGRLAKQTEIGMADTLFEYDAMGDITRSGLDMNRNGQLNLASNDRITDSDRVYQLESGIWYDASTTTVYPVTNDSTQVTVSTAKRQLSGFNGNLAGRDINFDIHGNRTIRSAEIDRANKTVTERTDTPFSSIDAHRVIVNGLLISQNTDTVAAATTYQYDDLERLIAVKEPHHTNSSLIEYYTGKDQIFTRTDADGNTTAYRYYKNGKIGAGKVFVLTDPLGQETFFRYDKRYLQRVSWGDAVYPQKYAYNKYAELISLTTWRDADDTYDFSVRPWPQPTDGDKTSWSYDASTGLLQHKKYADGTKVRYNYNNANRLTRRTWARDGDGLHGLHTIYHYNKRTGELKVVNYEDPSTSDIHYKYDRLGRQVEVSDATGARTFSYDPDTLQLVAETLDPDFYGGHQLLRQYDPLGRALGYELQNSASTALSAVHYSYDTSGRLSSVSDGSDAFTYGYAPNSNLLASIAAPEHTVNYTYEANRDLMTIIDNQASGASLSRYEYTYDSLGRRSNRSQSGSAINRASTDTFGYNNRSEVIGSTNSTETAPEWNPTYTYDNIGNRKSSTGIATASYTTNELNQYSTISAASALQLAQGLEPVETAVNPTYDPDGNLTGDGGNWTYTWNNENRLKSATSGTTTLNFTYDYQGRLVKKDDGTDIEVYVYDGWNRIATFDVQGSTFDVQASYLWGLDLSGTPQGAGGVGGLLKEGDLYPTFDANGNVMQKLDGNGAVVMSVGYDPFGNIIEGTLVGEYGFSTKPLIENLNWYYYGFRYYDPVTGRWPNSDPIEEQGGINLYGIVRNDLMNNIEYLGLKSVPFLFIDVYRVDISVLSLSFSTGNKAVDTASEVIRDIDTANSILNHFRTKLYEVYLDQEVKDCYIKVGKDERRERRDWRVSDGGSAFNVGISYILEITTEYLYEPKPGYDENCCKKDDPCCEDS